MSLPKDSIEIVCAQGDQNDNLEYARKTIEVKCLNRKLSLLHLTSAESFLTVSAMNLNMNVRANFTIVQCRKNTFERNCFIKSPGNFISLQIQSCKCFLISSCDTEFSEVSS